jgi:hypothetical protein
LLGLQWIFFPHRAVEQWNSSGLLIGRNEVWNLHFTSRVKSNQISNFLQFTNRGWNQFHWISRFSKSLIFRVVNLTEVRRRHRTRDWWRRNCNSGWNRTGNKPTFTTEVSSLGFVFPFPFAVCSSNFDSKIVFPPNVRSAGTSLNGFTGIGVRDWNDANQ